MGPVEMENSDWEMEGNPWLHDTGGAAFFGGCLVPSGKSERSLFTLLVAGYWLLAGDSNLDIQ